MLFSIPELYGQTDNAAGGAWFYPQLMATAAEPAVTVAVVTRATTLVGALPPTSLLTCLNCATSLPGVSVTSVKPCASVFRCLIHGLLPRPDSCCASASSETLKSLLACSPASTALVVGSSCASGKPLAPSAPRTCTRICSSRLATVGAALPIV